MFILKDLYRWFERKNISDIKKVRVTSFGAFYMKSEDIFDDAKKPLELIEKLDKNVAHEK